WYRQIPSAASGYEEVKRRGYEDWREVPQEALVEMVTTEAQWQNEIRWARNDLRKQRYLDQTVTRGIWKLSAAGLKAARSPEAAGLSAEEQQILSSRDTSPQTTPPPGRATARERGMGLRQELHGTLELLTNSMPLADLQLLVDLARAVRRRSLPEKLQ